MDFVFPQSCGDRSRCSWEWVVNLSRKFNPEMQLSMTAPSPASCKKEVVLHKSMFVIKVQLLSMDFKQYL